MGRKWVLAAAVALGLVASTITPAAAVTNGEPDAGRHPYVGLMVAKDASGAPMWRCSGTMVSPRVFLTAGHCTHGAARVTIWFEEDIENNQAALGYPTGGKTSVDGTPHTHPLYDDRAFYLYDVGVVVLNKPVKMPAYGRLPRLDSLDRLKPSSSTLFTAVGYGLQSSSPSPVEGRTSGLRIRLLARPHLVQINTGYVGDFALLLSNNASTGGTCFGDSGGPNFLGDSNVVAAVTSFGNSTCSGTGGVYRIDRADDLDWLASFGVRP